VAAKQPGIDPVGCCVGLRGIRIQNIVSELSGEKIDVVQWNPDPATFIASALSPAQIVAVELNKADGVATVVTPDRHLSLAIGKEGQNARLAAKLTGWKIDIKAASVWEAEKEILKSASEEKEEIAVPEPEPEVVPTKVAPESVQETVEIEEPVAEEAPVTEIPSPPVEEVAVPVAFVPKAPPAKRELRFAEEIIGAPAQRSDASKGKKKKKGGQGKEREGEEGSRARKGGRRQEINIDVEDEY